MKQQPIISYIATVCAFALLLLAPLDSSAQLFKKKKDKQSEAETTDNTEEVDDTTTEEPKEKKGLLKKVFGKKDKDEDGAQAETQEDSDQPKGLKKLSGKVKTLFGADEDEDDFADDPSLKQRKSQKIKRLQTYASGYEESISRGDYEEALKYLEMYHETQDSLILVKSERQKVLRLAEKQRAEIATQRLQSYSMLGGLIILLLLAGIFLVLFIQKRKRSQLLAEKNSALSQANEEIQAQQNQLQEQHKEILESINYARRIQHAILPATQHIHASFSEAFVFYRPKDIVSGDFFWFWQNESRAMIAAVDCTGHGVPGAFMSVLGMSLLNQIVVEDSTLNAGQILNRLHQGVISSLHQKDSGASQQDGMDIGIIVWEKNSRSISFAGANNPLYVVNDKELHEIKGDKSPVGGAHFASHSFANHEMELAQGASCYLFSDGLADQFGGPRSKKFTYKRMRELLTDNQEQPLAHVSMLLENAYMEWKGDVEQLDDVLVIGLRI